MPMHQIVSACGIATYNTAKFITKILHNYHGKTSSLLKASTDFNQKIKHLSINPPKKETLVSFDVHALFPSLPVPVALQGINSKISTCTNFTNVCKIPTENSLNFWNSLSPTISSASIRASINNYRVQPWVHLSPHHCKNLHGTLWILSHSYISNINQMVVQVCWWCPQCHKERSSQQTSRAPQFHRSTHQFTTDFPETDGPFLDTLTKPTSNSIQSTVYRKPNHTDRYLDYSSKHSISAKLSVIHTLIYKAKQVSSALESSAKDHLHKVLQDNHFPAQFNQQGKA